ncbi:hypothetical protein [Pseudorhizobium marinum]|jgi:hypothetical protein|nr:hypothetical protein [Pseudorhizobium marinum]MBU1314583.1 hypothetical protein [Alphaproteobacteria bacterium]MBU1548507.1 hypothetical protein [Alphaproteobacteria bacterium]MBU2337703.1 hypothetical protein [Alphaproteobacteria bacterium]MBU2389840.1 hypothetical protein [Alphaproteobacteria bacterium]
MSRRFRNLLCAFGVSISMWIIIIQASVAFYDVVRPGVDGITTASVR